MAARYFINGGVDNNWSTSGNWSATSGGAASGVKPTAADDVFFDVNSPNCTIDSAGVGKTINFTGYVSTITMTFGLTISGNVTLVAAMTIAGTGSLTINATATITSNTKVFPNAMTFGDSLTITLADDLRVTGSVAISRPTLNGNTLYIGGNFINNLNSSGTTNIVLNGTGAWYFNVAANGPILNTVTINTSGTITMSGLMWLSTFTHTAGTVITTGVTLRVSTGTLNISALSFENVDFRDLQTITLTSDLYVTVGLVCSRNTINGSSIYIAGNYNTGTLAGYGLTATTIIVLNGTGTWSGLGLGNQTNINTTGTITITTSYVNGAKLLYLAGTVITSAGTWTTGGGGSVGFFIQ